MPKTPLLAGCSLPIPQSRNHSITQFFLLFLLAAVSFAQDAATGALRGVVTDQSGARIADARIVVTNNATGVERVLRTSTTGQFAVQMLPPGEYSLRAEALAMSPETRTGIQIDLGVEVELTLALRVAGAREAITVEGGAPLVETQPGEMSNVIDQRAIAELPLNGRRFSDLALLTPGVTQDPRSLTSGSNGDLAFGGIRGFQTSFQVDGSDNNNAFFAQAHGRYRAPYQFSNDVIKEFRVSTGSYDAEAGRTAGAVINVVTRSGSNRLHGSAFYYLRDSIFNAQNPFTSSKPADHQHQFGFTIGGPIRKEKLFYFAGFDQHVFHVPTLVQFPDPSQPGGWLTQVTPQPGDYDSGDQALVFAAAAQLSALGGNFRTALIGNTAFTKIDWPVSPRHFLTARLNSSRFWGANNVYFDPASPLTNYAISNNGEEDVTTDSAHLALTSALAARATSILRVQFSRDFQESGANSSDVLQKVTGIMDGMGRASILPRQTHERRLHVADTITLEGKRHKWKLGGDVGLTWIRNYYPLMFSGDYNFSYVKVDPWYWTPQSVGGLDATPLRAYAHQVPRYYSQDFGSAVSHPDTKEYAWFLQDSIRLTRRLGVSLGLRYDLQTFRSDGLVSNPLWPDSGKMPGNDHNFAPRAGFAYAAGHARPLVVRGGWGMFYARIPQMYSSAVETGNGLDQAHVFLDNQYYWDRIVFPAYPAPLASCPPGRTFCPLPPQLASSLAQTDPSAITSNISAFAHDFHTPVVQHASFGIEKALPRRLALAADYRYVHGQHLIRSRDVNLPPPVPLTFPVYDSSDSNLLGYYTVHSFATWRNTYSVACPYPPCLLDPVRPIPQVGAINVFESAASSVYHGLTVSARRRMTSGVYFRLAYTWAHAIDDIQDALVTDSSGNVQNSYATAAERGPSVTDQRQRFVFSWVLEQRPFRKEHPVLRAMFSPWKVSGVVTAGSGRPVNARVIGDPNGDSNTDNDRLPGVSRNSYISPGYATTDLRLARQLHATERLRLQLLAESFNLFNRNNQRYDLTDGGSLNTAATFSRYYKTAGGRAYPAHFRLNNGFLRPTNAYAPRQLQFSLRLSF